MRWLVVSIVLVGCGAALEAPRNVSSAGSHQRPPPNASGDRDVDSIADTSDACPDDPEDLDERVDHDGCPDPDDDLDHIADADDRCPIEPEDRDGWEDDDGCPDADDDRDRFVDAVDHCPREPETYNGIDDDDGCPDRCELPVYACPIQLQPASIHFSHDSARITLRDTTLLRALADALIANPEVSPVELHGHAGREERGPTHLALRRAERLRDLLVAMGVDPARLVVHAHGADRPATRGLTSAERAANRRVELVAATP